jgi:hypothetical protein
MIVRINRFLLPEKPIPFWVTYAGCSPSRPMKNGVSPMDGITTLSVTLIAEAKVMFGH